jgi:hypothetical protein
VAPLIVDEDPVCGDELLQREPVRGNGKPQDVPGGVCGNAGVSGVPLRVLVVLTKAADSPRALMIVMVSASPR